jgi:arylsulfatase
LYQDVEVPFAPTCTEEAWRKLPPFFSDINEGRARWRSRFDEPKKAQKMIKNYYRLISGVDMTIGKILEEVERQGLMNNTMILFTTDNGYYHAEHGLADKFYAHQESVRVPLIIKDPRMNKDLIGTKNEELTLSIDLAPTLLQVGNLDIPDRMQGVDMSPLYTGTKKGTEKIKTEWRKGFYYEYPGIYKSIAHIPVQALVRKDYKYIYWPTKNYEELFHLPSDQYEEHDLARNPTSEIKTLLEKLRAEFKKVQSEAQ